MSVGVTEYRARSAHWAVMSGEGMATERSLTATARRYESRARQACQFSINSACPKKLLQERLIALPRLETTCMLRTCLQSTEITVMMREVCDEDLVS